MKPIFIISILLLFPIFQLFSQEFGLNISYSSFRPLNHIIDRYNETRPWLNKEMGNIHMLPGISVAWGVNSWDEKSSFEIFSWKSSRATVESKGQSEEFRKLRFKMTTLSIVGAGFYFINGNKFKIGIGTRPAELSLIRVKSKTDSSDKYETLLKSNGFMGIPTSASSTLYLDFMTKISDSGAFKVKFYWQFGWWKNEEMIYVNKAINPLTVNDTYQSQEMGLNNIGVQLLFTNIK